MKIKKIIILYFFTLLFPCQLISQEFNDYIDYDLNGKSGYYMSKRTKSRLRSYYQHHTQPIHGAALDAKHDSFDDNKKSLIKEWEKYSEMNWPRYNEDRVMVNRKAGDRYDAHHIIPQSHNGPNEWWNLFPLTNQKHHQVHSNRTRCSNLFPSSRGNGREDEDYLP
jgi:hypothetical protein